MNINELLERQRQALKELKVLPVGKKNVEPDEYYNGKFLEEPWVTKCYKFLTPVGEELNSVYVHVYKGQDSHLTLDKYMKDASYVMHGHTEDSMCHHEYMCHLLGYLPVGTEHPRFMNNWNKRWKEYYG